MTTTTPTNLAAALRDGPTRMLARLGVATTKTRMRGDLAALVTLALALDNPTRTVAIDDLHDFVADLAATLPPRLA